MRNRRNRVREEYILDGKAYWAHIRALRNTALEGSDTRAKTQSRLGGMMLDTTWMISWTAEQENMGASLIVRRKQPLRRLPGIEKSLVTR